MTTEKYLALRDGEVRKANELIQKSRFNMTARAQKAILYIISQVKPWDEDFKVYEFSMRDFCKVCGISEYSENNYADIKDLLEELKNRKIYNTSDNRGWWTGPDGKKRPVTWLCDVAIIPQTRLVQVEIDEYLKPYLIRLKEHYTKYELIYTLRFRSKYSIRLYELIKSVHYHDLDPYTVRYTIEELAGLIGAERYKEYRDFKYRALLPAVREINDFSDKNLSYKEVKTGRKVTAVEFVISTKDTFETAELRDRIEKELGTDQMTFFDQMKERGVV